MKTEIDWRSRRARKPNVWVECASPSKMLHSRKLKLHSVVQCGIYWFITSTMLPTMSSYHKSHDNRTHYLSHKQNQPTNEQQKSIVIRGKTDWMAAASFSNSITRKCSPLHPANNGQNRRHPACTTQLFVSERTELKNHSNSTVWSSPVPVCVCDWMPSPWHLLRAVRGKLWTYARVWWHRFQTKLSYTKRYYE